MGILTFVMIVVTIIAAFAHLGLSIKFNKDRKAGFYMGGVMALIILMSVLPGAGITALASHVSINGQLTFNEMWNGYEKEALKEVKKCKRDSGCSNTYSCDPYTVNDLKTYTDSNGNMQTRVTTKTEYHSCPYSKEETSYYVKTTLPYTVSYGDSLMTGEPFREKSIPGGRQSDPQEWLDAKSRIEKNTPLGVSIVKQYKNYILGTSSHIYGKDSSMVDYYLEKSALPKINFKNNAFGEINKYYTDTDYTFEKEVGALNGALGASGSEGDLHVILINSETAEDPEQYTNALAAYWMSTEHFQKNSLPKNAVVVVIGVNNDRVEWARSFTGMPSGNEGFMREVRETLPGLQVNSELFGSPGFSGKTEEIKRTTGVLEGLLLDGDTKFQRTSMSGDGNESAGFMYLESSIKPTGTAVTVATIFWLISLAIGVIISWRSHDALYDFFSE